MAKKSVAVNNKGTQIVGMDGKVSKGKVQMTEMQKLMGRSAGSFFKDNPTGTKILGTDGLKPSNPYVPATVEAATNRGNSFAEKAAYAALAKTDKKGK